MSKQATLQIRVDETIKQQAEQLFETIGLSTSEAVRLFITQSINERRLPFTPHLNNTDGSVLAFGKLRHYGNPELVGDERSAWLQTQNEKPKRDRTRSTAPDKQDVAIVDETILLRYLLDDDSRQSAKAYRIIASNCAQTYPEVVSRTVYLLEEDYHVPRSLIGNVIPLLASDLSIQDSTAIRLAARLYAGNRLSFTDCLTAARSTLTGYHAESFNKQLSKILS